ncbi:DMT family transporter [Candidatus Micrarchaeota archaeon]|nr:DMT family transporter [Candidatus Micrarchaeota archaeon]
MDSRTRWMVILFIAMAVWASFHPIAKLVLNDVSPLTLSFFRLFFALFFFVPYLAYQKQIAWPEKKDWKYVFINAAFGAFLAVWLNNTGLQLSTASASAVLVNANPLFVALLAAAILRERLTPRTLAGLSLAFFGIVLVVTNGELAWAADPAYFAGNLLLLAGAFCIAIAAIAIVPLAKKYRAVQGQFWGILPALAGFFITWLALGEWRHAAGISIANWAGLFWIGFVVSGVCWSLLFEGIKQLGVVTASSFKLLLPVFAVAYSALFLGEQLSAFFLAGMALVLSGLYWIAVPKTAPAIKAPGP